MVEVCGARGWARRCGLRGRPRAKPGFAMGRAWGQRHGKTGIQEAGPFSLGSQGSCSPPGTMQSCSGKGWGWSPAPCMGHWAPRCPAREGDDALGAGKLIFGVCAGKGQPLGLSPCILGLGALGGPEAPPNTSLPGPPDPPCYPRPPGNSAEALQSCVPGAASSHFRGVFGRGGSGRVQATATKINNDRPSCALAGTGGRGGLSPAAWVFDVLRSGAKRCFVEHGTRRAELLAPARCVFLFKHFQPGSICFLLPSAPVPVQFC